MNKPKFETPDMTMENIDKIANLFPNCITEIKDTDGKLKKAVNFDMLKQMLSKDIAEGDEAYEFTWVGKKAAIVEANTPIRKTLRPVIENETTPTGKDSEGNPYCSTGSVNWDTTQNIYIEGDNLEVLKLLQESYLNKIKMIYIDPPYNTGSDSFVYDDNFEMNKDEYEEGSGLFDENGNKQFKENNDSRPRFHSDWCSMIYSRLLLARNLLKEDGVIFISIDDNEVESLREICDEVFGESNFIAQIVWEKVHTRKNSAIYFSSSHEYVLCYAKLKRVDSNDKNGFIRNLLPRDNTDAYSNPDNDPKGPWKTDPITAHNYYAADYTITKPNGIVIKRPQDRYWAYSEESIKKMIAENALVWGEGDSIPLAKRYLCDVQDGLVPITIFSREFAGDSSLAKRKLDELFPECKGIFDYSKPTILISRLLQIGTNKNDIVLDFFSGSATTAHAVMQLNADDGGNRQFIMVQLPEKTDDKSEAFKAGFKNICKIGKERIRRAGKKILEEHPDAKIDTGFRVLKVDDTNMKDVYYSASKYSQDNIELFESNIKEGRTAQDLLFGCLLDWGLSLSLPYTLEEIEKFNVITYNNGDLIACFDTDISESLVKEIARRKPLRALFRDSSFANSSAKINVFEIFKMISPDTDVKVI